MKNIPKIKSKWTDGKGSEFQVITVEFVDSKLWVHYTKLGTDNTYNCYVDAFTDRFTENLQ
jgi:phosphoglucomutase